LGLGDRQCQLLVAQSAAACRCNQDNNGRDYRDQGSRSEPGVQRESVYEYGHMPNLPAPLHVESINVVIGRPIK
jgi:hypothetical protein